MKYLLLCDTLFFSIHSQFKCREQEDAFKSAKIREIYMRYCGLTNISPLAFDSLVNSLQILDLSGNNLTHLHHKLFNNFDVLR